MVKALAKRLRAYFWDVAAIKTHPHEIALGFAVGVFISTMPTPGFNLLLGFISLFFIRMNKIALLAGIAFVNPFLTPFIYATELQIGRVFFSYAPLAGVPWYAWENLLANVKPFYFGAFILATWVAIISYLVVYLLVYMYQMRKHKGLHPRSLPRAPIFYRLRDAGKYTTTVGISTVRKSTHIVKTTGRAGVETVRKGARVVTPILKTTGKASVETVKRSARAVTPILKTTGRVSVETIRKGGRVVAPLLRKRGKGAKREDEPSEPKGL